MMKSENFHLAEIDQTKDEEYFEVNEMAVLKPKTTNLPVTIWIDDGGTWKKTSHGPRIKFASEKGITPDSRSMVPMIISDDPKIDDKDRVELKLKDFEVNQIRSFVKINKDALLKVSNNDNDYDISSFLSDMKPYSKKNESSFGLCNLIEIKEDVRIPQTNIVLEKGDKIEVLAKELINER